MMAATLSALLGSQPGSSGSVLAASVVLMVLTTYAVDDLGVVVGVEEVLAGEAEAAGWVEHGGVGTVRAQLLRAHTRGGDAGAAGSGVPVAAAEREAVDSVRCDTGEVHGEVVWTCGGLVGELGG